MSRTRALALVAALILPLCAQSVLTPVPAGAIMGGIPVPSSVAPSVVALVDRRFNDQFCGGTVVAAEWILTAAHCAIGYRSQPGTIEVVGGRADLRTQTGTVIPVLEIVIHPAFDRAARRNDLALLRLTAPMPQPAAPLMTADVEPAYTGVTTGVVAGWGADTPNGSAGVADLRVAPVPLLADSVCVAVLASFLSENHICAGNSTVGPCPGDSGGPLLVADTRGITRIAGVVSYGSDPCNQTPAGFSQVSANVAWIQSLIGTSPPPPPPTPPTPAPNPTDAGYWMLGADGKVYPFGAAAGFGDPAGQVDGAAVGMATTPDDKGYWVVTTTGRVFNFGSAPALGSVAGGTLIPGELVTGLAATPTGKGYVVFSSRGRAVSFGDAPSAGDMTATALNGPVLGGIVTPSGRGYYMVASDGGLFTFGDAAFRGSMGATRLNAPVRGLVPTATGNGYWLVASDGGIFTFGDAVFRGSMGATRLNRPVVGMVRYGNGYLMVGSDGGIFTFSDLAFVGSLGGTPPLAPITSVAVV
jgi:hypothetical protein